MIEIAKQGRPFMMNVQSDETTRQRIELYCNAQADAGYDDETIRRNLEQTWVWRNVYVAATDAEAESVAIPAFERQLEFREAMRNRIYREQGVAMVKPTASKAKPARAQLDHALMMGDAKTVAQRVSAIADIGVGGLMMQFRLGPMPHELADQSIRRFMAEVSPQVSAIAA